MSTPLASSEDVASVEEIAVELDAADLVEAEMDESKGSMEMMKMAAAATVTAAGDGKRSHADIINEATRAPASFTDDASKSQTVLYRHHYFFMFLYIAGFVFCLAWISPSAASPPLFFLLMDDNEMHRDYRLFPSVSQWIPAYLCLVSFIYHGLATSAYATGYSRDLLANNNPSWSLFLLFASPVVICTGCVLIGLVDFLALFAIGSMVFAGWLLLWSHESANSIQPTPQSAGDGDMESGTTSMMVAAPHEPRCFKSYAFPAFILIGTAIALTAAAVGATYNLGLWNESWRVGVVAIAIITQLLMIIPRMTCWTKFFAGVLYSYAVWLVAVIGITACVAYGHPISR